MRNEDVRTLYLKFLMDLVRVDNEFTLLCSKLLDMSFTYDPHMITDRNRADDGWDLRGLFLDRHGYFVDLGIVGPSVLEVLVALAIRIDKDIMGEPGEKDPSKWFELMLENLGLSYMNDHYYDAGKIEKVIHTWLKRQYKKNGEGSLFPLKNMNLDQRGIAIWDQMTEYMVENY